MKLKIEKTERTKKLKSHGNHNLKMNEDSGKIRIVGAHSITEEAFENFGDENHMSVFDFVDESIVQNFVQEGADSIDHTDQNTVLYLTT